MCLKGLLLLLLLLFLEWARKGGKKISSSHNMNIYSQHLPSTNDLSGFFFYIGLEARMSPSALLSIRVCSQYCYPKEVSPPLFLFLTYYEVAQLCSPLMNLAEEQLKRFASAKKKEKESLNS